MPEATILVTGATGKVGRQVVTRLHEQGFPVRALVRDPDKAGFPDDVELAVGDLTEPDTVADAVTDIDAVFLLWPAFGDDGAESTIRTLAARARRIVYLSSDGAQEGDDGPVAWAARVERLVERSGVEWTHLRPTGFAGNTLGWAEQIRHTGVVRAPFAKLSRTLIHEADIAAVAVLALTTDGHQGKRYTLTGPDPISQEDQARTIGAAIGKPVRFEELSSEEAAKDMRVQGWPEHFIDSALTGWASMLDDPEVPNSAVCELTGRPAHTFAEWARDHVEDFR